MKVLWYVNILMPDVATAMGLGISNAGGWLVGAIAPLKSQAQLTVVNVSELTKKPFNAVIDGVNYVVLPLENSREGLESEIEKISPDIVHIFGTEYTHNINVADICREKHIKYVISIQGLMKMCAQHYLDGVDKKYQRVNPALKIMKKLIAADSMAMAQRSFEKQGVEETRVLSLCENVIGRTEWDRNAVLSINPKVNYYHVNESLRDVFYNGEKWQWDSCQKHSIFLGGAAYPIKGVHQIIPSIANLKKKYPDLKVYISGGKPYTLGNRFLDTAVNYFFEYQGYIHSLIKKYNLSDTVKYIGGLSGEKMKAEFLRANVFVSCSTIENSSNAIGEAMLTGTPVVASRVGGTPTMLEDNEDGLLYDFFDNQKFEENITEMFENRKMAEFYSKNAVEHALRTHDRDENNNALIRVYNKILN